MEITKIIRSPGGVPTQQKANNEGLEGGLRFGICIPFAVGIYGLGTVWEYGMPDVGAATVRGGLGLRG